MPGIEWHFFKVRAVPCENEFQHVQQSLLEVYPPCRLFQNLDGLGNGVQWGTYDSLHDRFLISSTGIVHQSSPYLLHETPAPYYLTQTKLTTLEGLPEDLQHRLQVVKENGEYTVFDLSRCVMGYVFENMTYSPGTTTVLSTARDVMQSRRGVCQDFAHVMIALCRLLRIHVRYVNGIMLGEGQTHAWVEVSDGSVWRAFDPTHNVEVEWGYVKIAHGRDADDCPSNRGRFYSLTSELMTVHTQIVSA